MKSISAQRIDVRLTRVGPGAHMLKLSYDGTPVAVEDGLLTGLDNGTLSAMRRVTQLLIEDGYEPMGRWRTDSTAMLEGWTRGFVRSQADLTATIRAMIASLKLEALKLDR
jgi:hypothetical protein